MKAFKVIFFIVYRNFGKGFKNVSSCILRVFVLKMSVGIFCVRKHSLFLLLFADPIQYFFFIDPCSKMKNSEIFDIWSVSTKETRNKNICVYIMQEFGLADTDNVPRVLQTYVSSLSSKIQQRWDQSGRNKDKFENGNQVWLNKDAKLPERFVEDLPSSSSAGKKGRPEKSFEECTLKVQKRKVQELVRSKTASEIALAAEINIRSAGKRDAAILLKELVNCSPQRATKIKKARLSQENRKKTITAEEALVLIVNTKMSTFQYNAMRQQLKELNSNVYPPYYLVQEAKKECYPAEEAFSVTDFSAQIQLQALLDLTVKRIIKAANDLAEQKNFLDTQIFSLRLISKWGCDGSSAQSRYKMNMSDAEYSDENLFSVTFVPLRLLDDSSKKIVWQNPTPNSTRYCRLIKFIFKKENTDLINTEEQEMRENINSLQPTILLINGVEVHCKHDLLFTMVDGKVCSALSQYTSSQKCYICGATPKEMNSSVLRPPPDQQMFNFGISPLHSWIRAFECLLHISYKLDIRKWVAKTEIEKQSVATRKKNIQTQFRERMGLLVDMPKQVAGNTNDGNTARKFFKNPEVTAEITGLNLDLINHFRVLLEVMSSECEIDAEKFGFYAHQTKDIYLQNYSWYYMPPSIHKILMHSRQIIEACILPLGQLSEEAQEASNKEYRRFREHFSRKSSRQNSNRDVINRFLLSSDPYISSRSIKLRKKRSPLSPECIELLKTADSETSSSDGGED